MDIAPAGTDREGIALAGIGPADTDREDIDRPGIVHQEDIGRRGTDQDTGPRDTGPESVR